MKQELKVNVRSVWLKIWVCFKYTCVISVSLNWAVLSRASHCIIDTFPIYYTLKEKPACSDILIWPSFSYGQCLESIFINNDNFRCRERSETAGCDIRREFFGGAEYAAK